MRRDLWKVSKKRNRPNDTSKQQAMNRITEDGIFVYPESRVWEIVYNYINPEISIAHPRSALLETLPINTKVWFHLNTIEAFCAHINKNISPSTTEHPIHAKELFEH